MGGGVVGLEAYLVGVGGSGVGATSVDPDGGHREGQSL